MPSIFDKLKRGWNAFKSEEEKYRVPEGYASYAYPDRVVLTGGNDRTIVNALYERIAIDASSIHINHVLLDTEGRFKEIIDDNLNSVFNLEANVDQTGRAFVQDLILTMFDEGCAAIVPTYTDHDPEKGTFEIYTARVGIIKEWYPDSVRVRVYNELTGRKEEVFVKKSDVGIIQNPFYTIMNEPNSVLKRLVRKLNLLDITDQKNSSGKLDLIIQLPYVIRSEAKRKEAEERRKQVEEQLEGSKYGIAYADGTERITQLNRPVENNLWSQVEALTKQLYSELGITEEIMNGTAKEEVMLNYYNRTVEPVLSSITDEIKRKFLTKTARTQGHTIMFFRDPFKLVPVNSIADIADKFTRNEILSSNEVRGLIGFKPSTQPGADELRNKNLNQSVDQMAAEGMPVEEYEMENQNEQFQQEFADLDEIDAQLDELERGLQ